MSSLIQGFEYDVFISYRHKDNKYDGWVTEFVANLRKELEATFKEDVSVYFDANPHDGLLETHQVDDSLKSKLKCLVFIPIISQTYCDPKSFAWQNEFIAFRDSATSDLFGLKVKLSNGNVASRILPIRIHEIDPSDKAILEQELGGVMRCVDFIYKSAGVNRPLRAREEDTNEVHTVYRNQINKVANAIKDLLNALRRPDVGPLSPEKKLPYKISASIRKKITSAAVLVLIASVGVFSFYYYGGIGEALTRQPSIAILPFTDISENHDQGYFSDGMMVEIMDHLYKVENLRVIPRTSVIKYKDSGMQLSEIARELEVATLLEGSVRKSGDQIKITVQLVNGENEKTIWRQTYDRSLADVFSVQSDVAQRIATSLRAHVTPDVMSRMQSVRTTSQDAYDLFLKARALNADYNGFPTEPVIDSMIILYRKAISLDKKFADAYTGLGQCYWMLAHYSSNFTQEQWRLSKEYILKALDLDPTSGWAYGELALVKYLWDSDIEAARKYFDKALELSPGNLDVHTHYFNFYARIGECEGARREFEAMKALDKNPHTGHGFVLIMCLGDTTELHKLDRRVLKKYSVQYHMLKGDYNTVIEKFEEYSRPWGFVGEAYARIGQRKKALQILNELIQAPKQRRVSNTGIASIYMALGDEDKCYQILEQALKERDWSIHTMFQFYYSLNQKRNDPRMKEFVKRSWTPVTEDESINPN
jgi:TolB-like protein